MSIKNIKDKLKNTSKKDTSWIENAKYRKENKAWLDISFSIAVKIMSVLKQNKIDNIFPANQKELAEILKCSPQNVNNLLSGTENFKLETITKIEQVLNTNLIQVPKFESTIQFEVKSDLFNMSSDEIIDSEISSKPYEELVITYETIELDYKLVA